jgi:cytochrome P450
MAVLVAANIDLAGRERSEQLDLTRRPNYHFSFATAVHFCLGYQRARASRHPGRC